MAWVAAIVVLILMVVSAGFRKFSLALIGLALIVGGGYYLHDQREEKLSLSRIAPSEIIFERLDLIPEYSSYKLTGRLINNSPKYTLQRVNLNIKMKDCAEEGPRNCVMIGEDETYIFLNIPPGQARELDEYVSFGGNLNPRGLLEWDYSIAEIRGGE